MTEQCGIYEFSRKNCGEVILYTCPDGKTALDVNLQDETVWLTQAQMVVLLQRDKRTISEHIRNVFREGELLEEAVVRESRTTAADGKTYQTKYYNLDVVISVGYRVKSQRGTQFRIWATGVLKDHLLRGYSLNRRRLLNKGVGELRQAMDLLAATLEGQGLIRDEGVAVLELVSRYARTWQLLLQYDENRLSLLETLRSAGQDLPVEEVRQAVAALRQQLLERGEATDLFGNEQGHGLEGILGAVRQTFGGDELYPGVEDKAAHLLYFIIKDHPFTDGNKRIGAFVFLLFLEKNSLSATRRFDNRAMVALALLIAASEPAHKEVLIRLVVNLIVEEGGAGS